ncbi:MAG: TonB-dependent receptor [Saprospiraceae bacterium]|nr:TonB-dependent receptor [Saprospiraceae bacterium]
MLHRIALLICLIQIFGSHAAAQQPMLSGVVVDGEGAALTGATVHWQHAPEQGVTTDQEGAFQLFLPADTVQRLLVTSFVGYKADTLRVRFAGKLFITLHTGHTLDEVQVSADRSATYLLDSPAKVEVISSGELKRAACCDLSGCFETTASVQAMTTNVLTQAKELRTLGLSGVYNQILVNGLPLIQGLSYTYGVNAIPGTVIKNIYVAKGASSVLQGFEGISGQINVEFKEADEAERLLLNAYANSFGETQYNASYVTRGKGWSNMSAAYVVLPAQRIDRDNDDFLDMPLTRRLSFFNQWDYKQEGERGLAARIGLRYVDEQRTGGQQQYRRDKDQGSHTVYGQTVDIRQPEFYTKTSYLFNANSRVTLLASAQYHKQSSYFGATSYDAEQMMAYANVQYEHTWAAKHDLKAGASYRYLHNEENIDFNGLPLGRTYDGQYNRRDLIPGVFAEQYFDFAPFSIIAGMRLDHHQRFGWFFTPRALVRYQLSEVTQIRLSAGTGFRTVNLFSENIGLLASSRDIVFQEDIKPERALNMGLNLNHTIIADPWTLTLMADFYRTQFQNQFFPDYDTEPTKAIIANFEDKSVSNSAQLEAKLSWNQRIEFKVAYNYLDVYRMEGEQKQTLPFNPKHKFMTALAYETAKKHWRADANLHWYGSQRLPNTSAYPTEFQQPATSKPYSVFSAQLTKVWTRFEVYAGCENIFDFRQLRPILSWQDPFGPYFDTAFNWGPTKGREIYLGVRYTIE